LAANERGKKKKKKKKKKRKEKKRKEKKKKKKLLLTEKFIVNQMQAIITLCLSMLFFPVLL